MSNVLADVGGFFVQIGPSLIKAVTNSGSKSDAIQPRAPALDGFIHADVVQARGLLPREPSRGGGAVKPELCGLLQQEGQDSDDDDDEGEVDPFVQVQVLVSDGAGLVTHHAAGSRTGTRTETSRPVFEEELVLADLEGADGLRFTVYDGECAATNILGFVDIPLPPRPLPLHSSSRRLRRREPPYKHGWFTLTATEEQMKTLRPRMQRCGRSETSDKPLGELHVRISWGLGVRNPIVNLRPTLRKRLAHLIVQVHSATGAKLANGEPPVVVARLEHQVGITPQQSPSGQWPAEESTFVFAVTEITADLTLSLVSAKEQSPAIGEVILPVTTLMASRSRNPQPRWATILPPRLPGEELLRPQHKPERDLGHLCFIAKLEFVEYDTPFAYMGEDVTPREFPPGKDMSVEFSTENLHNSMGRVFDCLVFPIFASMRTLLYLQSWFSPRLNVVLLAVLALLTHARVWTITIVCIPLWLLLFPFLTGYVCSLIHADDPVILYKEDEEALKLKRAEVDKHELQREALVLETRNKLLHEAAKHDPAYHAHKHQPKESPMSHLQHILGDAAHKVMEDADHMNIVKTMMTKLAHLHVKMLTTASSMEKLGALFSWTDRRLSLLVFFHILPVGILLSAVHGVVLYVLHTLSWRMCTLLAGLYCFMPFGAPITRAILENVDDALIAAHSACTVTPLLSGALLKVPPPASELLHGPELQAAVEADARKFVAAKEAERIAAIRARGHVHPRRLQLTTLMTGGYFSRLLARSPDIQRQTHVRMCTEALVQ